VDRLLELALAVKAAHRELDRWMNEAMRPLGLTGAQADALVVIAQASPVSLKELGELLIAESGHPSRLVDRLVDAGHIARQSADTDRRRIVLTPTPTGRRLARRVVAERAKVLALGRELLGDDDIQPALDLAARLLVASPQQRLIERRRELDERKI
jgi:MarR family transcriptional regulator, organic hydroperoxide resistance regulator